MAELADFEIHLSPDPAECRYLVAGKEIGGVLAAGIAKEDSTGVPIVRLDILANSVAVSGFGHAAISLGLSAEEFLNQIDTKELEQAALSNSDYSASPIEAALVYLKKRASGQA